MKITPVHETFDRVASNCPERIAIVESSGEMSFGSLKEKINTFKGLLDSMGVGKGITVAVAIPSSSQLIMSMLGTFKSNGVYVPIDLRFSREKLKYILSQILPRVIVIKTGQENDVIDLLNDLGFKSCYILCINKDFETSIYNPNGDLVDVETLNTGSSPVNINKDCDYIFYTSGTTGQPKAIMGTQKALAHFIEWETTEFDLNQDVIVSQLIATTFDASLRDMLIPLCVGGTLCIPHEDYRHNTKKLVDWIENNNISLIHTVPSMFKCLMKELEGPGIMCNLFCMVKYIMLSGEPLFVKDIRRWRNLIQAPVKLVNLYGATETTMIRTFHVIQEIPGDDSARIPVGKPINDTVVAIINQDRVCRKGELGEVYIKTPYWSKGYLNNPKENAKVFVQNPLVSDRKDIVYKTGDLGKYTQDNDIEIVGRIDNQLKINGIRVELDEINKVFYEFDEIDEVLITPWYIDDECSLIAYYTAHQLFDEDALEKHVRRRLDPWLIPSQKIRLDEMPLNSNGKIDRKALPSPGIGRNDELTKRDLPKTRMENSIASIWKDILGKNVVRNESFFKIGGTSLKAIQMISRIYKKYEILVGIADIFSYQTVEKLAMKLENMLGQAKGEISPIEEQEYYEASHAQKRIWTAQQLDQGGMAYNVINTYSIEGELDLDVFEQSVKNVVDRHESLRTTFQMKDHNLITKISQGYPIGSMLHIHDHQHKSNAEQGAIEFITSLKSTSFDLAKGPLFHIHIVKIASKKYGVLLLIHHIIADGWSVGVFLKELLSCYNSGLNKLPNPLQAPVVQYKDFIAFEKINQGDEAVKEYKNFWHKILEDGMSKEYLLPDFPRAEIRQTPGDSLRFVIPTKETVALKFISEQCSTSLFTVLTAVTNLILYRYSGQEKIILGTDVLGRDMVELEDQIGMFVNTIVLVNNIQKDHTFLEFVGQVHSNLKSAYKYQSYPFDALVEELGEERSPGRFPVFDIFILMQGVAEGFNSLPSMEGVKVKSLGADVSVSKFDLTLKFWEFEEQIQVILEFNTSLYSKATIQAFGNNFARLVSLVASNTQDKLKDIHLPTPEVFEAATIDFTNKIDSFDF